VKLVWFEEFPTREEAKAVELQIKNWNRRKKEALIAGEIEIFETSGSKKLGSLSGATRVEMTCWIEAPLDTLPTEPTRGVGWLCAGLLESASVVRNLASTVNTFSSVADFFPISRVDPEGRIEGFRLCKTLLCCRHYADAITS